MRAFIPNQFEGRVKASSIGVGGRIVTVGADVVSTGIFEGGSGVAMSGSGPRSAAIVCTKAVSAWLKTWVESCEESEVCCAEQDVTRKQKRNNCKVIFFIAVRSPASERKCNYI
jgi:hypothetical protein